MTPGIGIIIVCIASVVLGLGMMTAILIEERTIARRKKNDFDC